MSEIAPLNRVEVSESALQHNIDLIAAMTGQMVIPVLRSNAYGHGLAQVSRAIDGMDNVPYVAVDTIQDAQVVREASNNHQVLVFGAIRPDDFDKIEYGRLAFSVHDFDTIRALGNRRSEVDVHLDVNTDLNRYGFNPSEISEAALLTQTFKNLRLRGVMSHLASAMGDQVEDIDRPTEIFDKAVDTVLETGAKPSYLHIAKTAASVRVNSRHANTVRVGEGVYGINPFPPDHPLYPTLGELRPAMKYISTITAIRDLNEGDPVGYGHTFTAPGRMRIGVLSTGLFDALDIEWSTSGYVKYKEKILPVLGKVGLNNTMISLEGCDGVATFDEVTVISDQPDDPNSLLNLARAHPFVIPPRIHSGVNIEHVLVP